MHTLLLNQFYPPDVAPTGRVLQDLARTLVRRGHEVGVICSQWSYDGGQRYAAFEVREGVRVRRLRGFGFRRRGVWAQLSRYAFFHLAVLLEMMRPWAQADVLVALTTPPYLGFGTAVLAGWRGSRPAHWVMDMYPDVMAAYGMLRRESVIFRFLQAMARLQLRNTNLVLSLGPFMADRLRAYVPFTARSEWVPLWGAESVEPAAPEAVARIRRARLWADSDLVLMYSGNMGLGHRFTEFLEAARRLGPDGPVWAFAGGGPRRGEVEAFRAAHPSARLIVMPYVSDAESGASLCAADVHLVSLASGWEGLIVPNKLQGAFSVGRPVLFVGPRRNEVAQWIEESGGGWVAGEGDVAGLLAAVEAARDPDERARRGVAALAFAREHFDRHTNCERIADLLEEVGGGRTAASGSRHAPARTLDGNT